MQVYDIDIDLYKQGLKKDYDWNHEMITDAHVGAQNFAKTEFDRTIKRVTEDPSRSTHFGGDNSDNMPPSHKWFDQAQANKAVMEIGQQMAWFWELIKPLEAAHAKYGNKILGFVEGNHEYNRGVTSTAFAYAYCKPSINVDDGTIKGLKYRYLGFAAYLTFNIFYRKQHLRSFTMLVSHGSFNGGQRGGDVNNMARSPAAYEADIRLEGHTHDRWFTVNPYIKPVVNDKYVTEVVEAERLMANGGCFLRGSIVAKSTPSGSVLGHNSYNEKRIFTSRIASVGTVTVSMNAYTGKLNGHL